VLLADRDRARWDHTKIEEGVRWLRQAMPGGQPGPYALQAAIAAVHDEAPSFESTDWRQIVALYDVLRAVARSPLVDLNRAVAVGVAPGPAAGWSYWTRSPMCRSSSDITYCRRRGPGSSKPGTHARGGAGVPPVRSTLSATTSNATTFAGA
jgi:hypothetical protein